MERIYIEDIRKSKVDRVLLRGWVHKVKEFKDFGFVQLRDKTGVIQLVVDKDRLKGLRLEMSVEVTGTKVENTKAIGGVEVKVYSIEVLGKTYYDMLPIPVNEYKNSAHLETELDYRYISLRAPKVRATFKVQEEITTAFRDYLKANKFSEIYTPKIIASGTEGGSELFTVNYFDNRAFLAQSPQFYKQMMVGAGFERVFEIGHAYRAELHNTWRHLNEYVSLDAEMGFIKDENDIMDLEEGFINYLFGHLKKTCQKELEMYDVNLPEKVEIPRIPLAEAHKILLDKYGKRSPVGNIDAEGEVLISKYVKETYDTDFVFLTEYPIAKRPMYTMPDGKGNTRSFDLIYKGLEITTGGQRINDYEMLKENIKKFGFNPDDYGFYLESFRYGMPPHGGFAIGLERITIKILNLQNVREASTFPRDMKRIEP
ncbi:aspartate--tRNA(Asn) ligase [Clostridium sp. JN-1]|uniref:aspartate--tRNA(Asn) ligase n=1 Tax=Clostridium sp. JN-1 TaxID=2483110 RepID=UPI000F0B0AE1|nr:aspartate--tRNA(Asn) ligase [Clostridium sp. JN-1]